MTTSHGHSRGSIVLLGMLTKMPVAGVAWQVLHYLEGFRRLGFDAWYVEDHGRTPSMFVSDEGDDGCAGAASFLASLLERFGFGDRWAFHALHADGSWYGISEVRARRLYRDAALIINLHGGTMPLPEHAATGRLVFLETDPVQIQIEIHNGVQAAFDFLKPHSSFFTFAENYGWPDCRLPVFESFGFRPTRQPVVLDYWPPGANGTEAPFTTVGNWRQPWRKIRFCGEVYHWSKHYEFLKLLELPSRTGQAFELALSGSSFEAEDRRLLEDKGWRVRDALEFSSDPDGYRAYITTSYGEFTVAKDQNVRLRTGWFSDRSATYLAAGRPVITQETGFSRSLPVGEGLLEFSTLDEAVAAVERVRSDYQRHRRAARELAEEYFSHEVVLGSLLRELGLARPVRTRREAGR